MIPRMYLDRQQQYFEKKGYDVHYAEWLITGKPRVVLLNPNAVQDKSLSVVKYLLWKNHGIRYAQSNARLSTRLFHLDILPNFSLMSW